jgi:hypothetical protein
MKAARTSFTKLTHPARVILFTQAAMSATLLLALAPPVQAADSQILRGQVPAVVSQLQPVERLASERHLNLAIGLPLRNQAGLTALLQQLNDPASPNYRQWLTPEQFTEKFGPTEADYQAVADWAKANGLKVSATHPNRVLLDVEGSVADIEQALHVRLQVYQHPHEARTFYAPDAEPQLDLAVPIAHISGLEDYALPRPHLKMWPLDQAPPPAPKAGSGPGGTYMANDFRAAYVPDVMLTGAGQAVGLLQFDGYSASDIAYYIATNHLASVTISNVLLDGFSGAPTGSGGEVEVCLDIEMTLSMAPGISTIYVYEAGPSGVWHDILNRMATDNLAKQLSCSWYIPGGAMDTVADGIFQQMAAQGQSFFNASGDADAYCGLIDFPGDTPYITQVGGTTLSTTGPRGAWSSEQVWNWGGGTGSGGGISTQYPIPTWQQGLSMTANHGSTTMRNTPDVALTADQVYVRADSVDQNVGGTSAAAPLWAGFCALVNQQAVANGRSTIGFVNPIVYTVGQSTSYSSVFHDITIGNNTNTSCGVTRFPAVTGYDLATGWGTPPGQALVDALAGPNDTLQISPGSGFSSSGGVGGPFTVTSTSLTLTNSGTNALVWSLSNTSLWLDVSFTGGSLSPGGPATAVTVSLDPITTTFALGTYSATVWFTNLSDGVGQGRVFQLAVIAPPTIAGQPTNQTVLDGSIVAFTVGANGGQPLSYEWQANSNNLADGGHIYGSGTATLTVSNVAPSDDAYYRVIVTNAAGMAVSSNALLTALPGTVDHFAWGAIASPQPPSFPVTIAALDPANVVATNFNGSANLSATTNGYGSTSIEDFESGVWPHGPWVLAISGTVLGTLSTSFAHDGLYGLSDPEWTYRTDFQIGAAGDVLSWWIRPSTSTGGRAYLGFAASGGGCWSAVAAPNTSQFMIQQNSGYNSYTVMAAVSQTWVASKWYKIAVQFSGTSAITADLYDSDGVTLLNTITYSGVTGLPGGVAMRSWSGYSLDTIVSGAGLLSFPITPTVATPFVQGLWSGGITALQIATNVTLKASDSAGHFGFSNPFDVTYANQPPLLTAQPADQIAPSGANATFTVGAIGTMPMSYFWSQNGVPIPGATSATFTTNNVPLSASGSQFSCVVTNTYGSTNTRTATLTVLAQPPAISQQPTNLSTYVGSSATFNVAATGSLPLSYFWERNGTFISGATNPSYTTNNVQVADSGAQFSCLVSNAYGTALSYSAVLTVQSSPTGVLTTEFASDNSYAGNMFDIVPKANLGINALDVNVGPAGLVTTITVYYRLGTSVGYEGSSAGWIYLASGTATAAGDNARTHVDISGNGVQFVQGQTYGIYVYANYSGGATMYYTDGSNTYENADLKLVTNCGNGDPPFTGGIFYPRIWNGAIYYGPPTGLTPVILTQPTNQTVCVGSTACFSVSASGVAPLSYFWQRNGTPIPGGTQIYFCLANVQLADSGSIFSCVVSNALATTTSSSAALTVVATPPGITQQPANQIVTVGGAATFSIIASGCPALSYAWQRNGAPIPGATLSSYTTNNVQLADSGSLFSCVVSNAYGTTNSLAALLTVLPVPPTITQQPTNQTVSLGASATFNVAATGSLPLSYAWRRNGTPIPGATLSTYTTNNIELADSGSLFSCLVTNAFGSALSSNALLTVLTPGTSVLAAGNLVVTLDNPGARIHSVLFQSNEVYRVGTYISDWGLQTGTNAATFVRNEANTGTTGQPMALRSASGTSAFYTGLYSAGGANVALGRNYTLVPGSDLLLTVQTFTNNAASSITLRCFDTFDPDWLTNGLSYYSMYAHRYTLVTNGTAIYMGRGILSPGSPVVILGTADPGAVLAACISSYFGIQSSANLNLFFSTNGGDSGGALVDLTLDIGRELVLAPGASASFVFYHSISTNVTQAESAIVQAIAPYGPPIITAAPTNQVVPVGGTATFSVGAIGAPPLGYYWQRNNAPIAGATASGYVLKDVQLSDSGSQFSCLVSNSFGTTNSPAGTLTVVLPPSDYFAEFLGAAITNIMASKTFTWTPDGSANFYVVCSRPALAFPTDPAGGTALTLGDDDYAQIILSGGKSVAIYTSRTNVIFIGSNGYLTMNAGDTSYIPSYPSHFALPRVSALYCDLDPTVGGTISWKQLPDRVAVTYQAVPSYGAANQPNSFQIELFFDGRIHVTYLSLNAPDGLVGLSAGLGQPINFALSDFSAYPGCVYPPPVIVPVIQTNGVLCFGWTAMTGQVYQVQCKSNLLQGIWNNLGSPLSTTTGILTLTETMTNSPRYYRVVLLP